MTESKRVFKDGQYNFTPNELRELGKELAAEAENVYQLRATKITVIADLGAQIKAAEKRVADLAGKITCGYEARPIECLIVMDMPRPGRKSFVRFDSQEVLLEEPMTEEELQQSFAFTEGRTQ
jgi:hypothetical protein